MHERSMQATRIAPLLICLLVAAPSVSVAGPNSYQCLIGEALFLTDEAKLRRPPDPIWIGRRFAVDRNTGALVGPETSLWSFRDSTATVLARGNSDNSFIVVLASPAAKEGAHVTKIVVQEYKSGPQKPFVVLTGTQVFTGICE